MKHKEKRLLEWSNHKENIENMPDKIRNEVIDRVNKKICEKHMATTIVQTFNHKIT